MTGAVPAGAGTTYGGRAGACETEPASASRHVRRGPAGAVFWQLLQRAASHSPARRFHARGMGAELPLLAKHSRGLGCPRPWPGAMRSLVLVAACAGARRLDIVGDGTRKYASQGACLDATTGIVTCTGRH